MAWFCLELEESSLLWFPWPKVQLAATVPHVVSFIRAQGIQGNEGGHPVPVRPGPRLDSSPHPGARTRRFVLG